MAYSNINTEKAAYFSTTVSAFRFVKFSSEIANKGLVAVTYSGAGEIAQGAVITTVGTAGVVRRYAPSGYGNRCSIEMATGTCSPGDMIMAAAAGAGKKLAVASTTAPVYCNAIALEDGTTGTFVLCELVSPFKVADKN